MQTARGILLSPVVHGMAGWLMILVVVLVLYVSFAAGVFCCKCIMRLVTRIFKQPHFAHAAATCDGMLKVADIPRTEYFTVV